MAEQENVITHTYDFLLYMQPQLEKYPRSQKFLLADRIQTLVMNILEQYIEAYYSPKASKRDILASTNRDLEKLRYWIRLSKDLKCISLERYEVISKKINEIGKENGAWLKTLN